MAESMARWVNPAQSSKHRLSLGLQNPCLCTAVHTVIPLRWEVEGGDSCLEAPVS